MRNRFSLAGTQTGSRSPKSPDDHPNTRAAELLRQAIEESFDECQIKQLCGRYGLRFLPYRSVAWAVDPAVLPAIAGLQAELGGRELLPGKFFVAVPPDAFSPRPNSAPRLLFYQVAPRVYYRVAQWGGTLSAWRYLKALPLRNARTVGCFRLLLPVYLLASLAACLLLMMATDSLLIGVLPTAASAWSGIRLLGWSFNETHEETWNKPIVAN